MTKQEARAVMKEKRSQMEQTERQRQNQAIREQLYRLKLWKQMEWFYPFVSYGTEVDTLEMIQKVLLRKDRKVKVAVPRVNGREMDFYQITSMKDLAPGYRGILEPVTQTKVVASEGVMLLPGLAFDQTKNRVGYGGGYYDRYLERYSSSKLFTLAVAYDFQVVDTIESNDYDISPNYIITPDGML